MTNFETPLSKLKQNIIVASSEIRSLDKNKLTEEQKLEYLNRLKVVHGKNIKYFDDIYERFPLIKLSLLERQKTSLENSCRKSVEHLGFDYDTDYDLASNLTDDYDTSSSISNPDLSRNDSQDISNIHDSEINDPTMADFDLRLANQIIPDFRTVEDFIHKSEFYHGTLNDEGKATFLNFLINVKLLTKVRNLFNTEPTPATFAQFKAVILKRFSDKTTEEGKMNQIERVTQEGSVASFATKLDNLIAELVNLKMKDQEDAARPITTNEVNKLGVRVFTKGLKRSEVRHALIYKEPTTLTEAIQFALEADSKFNQDRPDARFNNFRSNRFNSNRNSNNFSQSMTNLNQNQRGNNRNQSNSNHNRNFQNFNRNDRNRNDRDNRDNRNRNQGNF